MATQEKNEYNFKMLGGIFMAFSAWSIVQAIIGFVAPGYVTSNSAAVTSVVQTTGMAASTVQTIVIVILAILIVIALVQFYFGYIAYKGHATKLAAVVCLVVGALGLLSFVVGTINNGFDFMRDVSLVCDSILAIMYWYYYKQLNA